MAVIYCDSFDHYTTPGEKGWTGSNLNIHAANGRWGTNALRTTQAGDAFKDLGANYPTIVAGFSGRFESASVTAGVFCRLRDATTDHITLRINTNRIEATRAGTVLGTGTAIINDNIAYYIEVKATIDDSTGIVIVRVNEVEDINLSNIDTRNGANAYVNVLSLSTNGFASGGDNWFDDLVVNDSVFLGDVRVEAIYPNGNGNSSVLVGSDGNSIDNYLLVDETAPNSDTDYVESSTVGDKDTYNYGSITPTTGSIVGIQVLPWANKQDAGTRSIVSVVRHSGIEEDSAAKTLSASYQYLPDIRETKPGGGSFSISDVNAMEAGVKVNA